MACCYNTDRWRKSSLLSGALRARSGKQPDDSRERATSEQPYPLGSGSLKLAGLPRGFQGGVYARTIFHVKKYT